MKKLVTLVFVFVPLLGLSQSLSPEAIFCSSGNHHLIGYAQLSWTLGDVQVKTLKSPDAVLTQGFLQPGFTITGIDQISDNKDITVKIFPNPVTDILHFEMEYKGSNTLVFELYSIDGKKLLTRELDSNQINGTIDFSSFQSGYYLLHAISTDGTYNKSFKIFYQQ